MKDQNSITDNETKQEKWNRGLDIFIESVMKPDPTCVNVLTINGVIMN
jgi:hypothetical protein